MENRFEKNIREKLQHREMQPSASAWERLSNQLDEIETKKKRNWFLYIGYAASIALILSLFFILKNKDANESAIPENTIVKEDVKELETKDLEDLQLDRKDFIPKEEEVVVEKTIKPIPQKEKIQKKSSNKPVIAAKENKKEFKALDVKKIDQIIKGEETGITQNDSVEKKVSNPTEKVSSNSAIKVDSDALLMSVTLDRHELKRYYADYKISKRKVLNIIDQELKKNNLRVDPNIILAEVEKDVNEESFQNNFYQFIKKRVSDVATAIANRNN